jgi:ADP-ribose pyrophosphatase YjhB (NUDIX family)
VDEGGRLRRGGYVTPKVAVGAVVGNEDGEILLVQRADSGVWLYPTGWADIGYSPVEVALKEVEEETGILCEPVRLIAVLDGLRLGFTRIPLYSVVFHLRAVGGELAPTRSSAPTSAGSPRTPSRARSPACRAGARSPFAAIRGEEPDVVFDPPAPPSGASPDRRSGAARRRAQARGGPAARAGR